MKAPKGMRLHIGLFGRRNVGKSSLLNALTGQNVSIVSPVAGTTTDPVEKTAEFLPLGPVVFIDTAGIDDEGALGELRIQKSEAAYNKTELGLVVTDGCFGDYEEKIVKTLKERDAGVLLVFNQCDLHAPDAETINKVDALGVPHVKVSAKTGEGIEDLRRAMLDLSPQDLLESQGILRDLVAPGKSCILVVPIDKLAPKGRLIMPQVQTIRDLLDGHAAAIVVNESLLGPMIANLREPPALVVTDSQAFGAVSAIVPESIPMTSFSILFARFKGDLFAFAEGARHIDALKPGDSVLIAEACTHHGQTHSNEGEDIGRVKIPRMLQKRAGGPLNVEVSSGLEFPSDLSRYKLVVHCGACVANRKAVLNRIVDCKAAGVPITNYGMAIAHHLGILARAMKPFNLDGAMTAEN